MRFLTYIPLRAAYTYIYLHHPQASAEVVLFVASFATDIKWLADFGPDYAKIILIPLLCTVPIHASILTYHQLTRDPPQGFDPRGPRPQGLPWYTAAPLAIVVSPAFYAISPLLALLDSRWLIWLLDPVEMSVG